MGAVAERRRQGGMGVLRYFFSFKGRINRAKLWLFALISSVVGVMLGLVDPDSARLYGHASLADAVTKIGPLAETSVWIGIVVINILLFWASVALDVKRLHDRDKGAAWLLVFYGIPIVCVAAIVLLAGNPGEVKSQFEGWKIALCFAAGVTAFVVGLWGFLEFYCTAGTEGDNRFGSDPLLPPEINYCSAENPVEGCIPRPGG